MLNCAIGNIAQGISGGVKVSELSGAANGGGHGHRCLVSPRTAVSRSGIPTRHHRRRCRTLRRDRSRHRCRPCRPAPLPCPSSRPHHRRTPLRRPLNPHHRRTTLRRPSAPAPPPDPSSRPHHRRTPLRRPLNRPHHRRTPFHRPSSRPHHHAGPGAAAAGIGRGTRSTTSAPARGSASARGRLATTAPPPGSDAGPEPAVPAQASARRPPSEWARETMWRGEISRRCPAV